MSDPRFVLIRYESKTGDTIARFDDVSGVQIPENILTYDKFVVVDNIESRAELTDDEINHSNLSEEEEKLLSDVFPIQS